MQTTSFSHCACGSARGYDACCARFHNDDEFAASAQTLMRSRYSAYVLALEDYLLATWHLSTRPASLDFSDANKTRWLGLEIKRHMVMDANRAQVEFVARYKSADYPPYVCMKSVILFLRTGDGFICRVFFRRRAQVENCSCV